MAVTGGLVKRLSTRLERIGMTNRSTRRVCALLVVLAVVGGVWLIVIAAHRKSLSTAGPRCGDSELLSTHLGPTGGENSLSNDFGNGESITSSGSQARVMPAGTEQAGMSLPESFERIIADKDIWRTQAQNDKRWQAAKMAWLSGLVSRFPAVKSATVIFEPGSRRKLGAPAVRATAAVNVCLRPGQAMTPELGGAIADLVSGSVAGMSRSDVCIVDSIGRSYRAPKIDLVRASTTAYERDELRRVEDACRANIRSMLSYVDGLLVTVKAKRAVDGRRMIDASVSVPRSYLVAAHLASGGEQPASEEQFDRAAKPLLARIKQSVMHVLDQDGQGSATVDWYCDVPAPAKLGVGDGPFITAGPASAKSAAGQSADTGAGSGNVELAVLVVIGVCWLAVIAVLARKKLLAKSPTDKPANRSAGKKLAVDRRKRIASVVPEPISADMSQLADGSAVDEHLAHLQEASVDQLLSVLRDENPQTIAMVLSRLVPHKAAAVLGMLARPRQLDVGRRLAGLGPVDLRVLREVAGALRAKLASLPLGRDGDTPAGGKLAEILLHAGYGTGQAVLQGLRIDQPVLAESIRNHLFAFEDISKLSAGDLKRAVGLVGSDDLAVALRTAGRDIRRKVFAALSSSRVRKLKQEMERIGPVRLSDVEAAQRQVVDAVRRAQHVPVNPGGKSRRNSVRV